MANGDGIKGTVFNIQHYSVHDGPGIRTVVFLKGCPLRCKWCANPESQLPHSEIAWTKDKCIACNSCVDELKGLECEFTETGLQWNVKAKFDPFDVKFTCASEALHVIGEQKSVNDVLKIVERDTVFFGNSNGGLTVSGGEPLMQPDFTVALLSEAKRRHINTAMESSGYARWESLRDIAQYLDYLLTDIKTMNDDVHKKYTAVSNRLILENLTKVSKEYPALTIHVRTPVIPGVNDTEDDIRAIAEFLKPIPNVIYELLKYHEFGIQKYESLNREYEMGRVSLSDEVFEHLKKVASDTIGSDRIFQNYYTEDTLIGENI